MTTTFAEVYAQQQKAMQTHVVLAKKKSRTYLGFLLGVFTTAFTKSTTTLKKSRRAIMYTSGFGFIAYAAWLVFPPLGFLVIGISLFLLDALTGGNE